MSLKRYEPGDLIIPDLNTSGLVIKVLSDNYILLIIDKYESPWYTSSVPVYSGHRCSTIFRGIIDD